MNWLIERTRPDGRSSYSNAEVADPPIELATSEQVSHATIWKLRNGQAANPQMKLIDAMARTFGVPPGFFFEDYDTGQAGCCKSRWSCWPWSAARASALFSSARSRG